MIIESMSILEIISLLFYLLGIFLIVISVKENFFSRRTYPSRKFRVLLLIFSIVSIIYFFGLFHDSFLDFDPSINPLWITLFLSIIAGGIIYFVILKVLLFIIGEGKIRNPELKLRDPEIDKTKLFSFIFLILICMGLFSYETNMIVQQNTYQIENNSTTTSSDFSKISYLVVKNNKPYLVIRNLQNINNYSIYSLSNLPCRSTSNLYNCDYINPRPDTYVLKYYDKQNTIFIIPTDLSVTNFFAFNLTSKSLTDYYDWVNCNPDVIQSTILYGCLVSNNNGSSLMFYENYTTSLANMTLPNSHYSLSYEFSPDHSKLVEFSLNKFTNEKILYFDIYNVNNYSAVNIFNQSFNISDSYINILSSKLGIIKWTDNNSIAYFYYQNDTSSNFEFT